jgi:hypothetical protein
MTAVVGDAFDFMNINSGCTIYNKHIVDGVEAYQRAQIEDIEWDSRKGANVLATGGNIAADAAKIVIPVSRGANYLPPAEWQALTTKTGKWTIQVEDYIVKGLVEDEISSAFTITDLKAKYDDVLRISSVDLKDGGSQFLNRWEVAAK